MAFGEIHIAIVLYSKRKVIHAHVVPKSYTAKESHDHAMLKERDTLLIAHAAKRDS
jgi:hypothetical protein